jgi:hypothetical protein
MGDMDRENDMPFIRRHYERNSRYREYLNSLEWKSRRQAVRERCKGICERCSKYLVDEVHHLTYANVFNEPLEDLQGLCRPCHSFTHGGSGIDPVLKSIRVKVAFKIIEYWDSEKNKFRRVPLDTIPEENFEWERSSIDGKLIEVCLAQKMIGLYVVPMNVFLDSVGTPKFVPVEWQKYKTGFRLGQRWYDYETKGRAIPPDPASVRAELTQIEYRKRDEESRQEESPGKYSSYQGIAPKMVKEVMAIFKRSLRIVAYGLEGEIRSMRATKKTGVVLDLHFEKADGCWIRTSIRNAEWKLNQGDILFDNERQKWVMKNQERRRDFILK